LRAEGVPYVSILTDPTTGGVFASYAALGDVNIAEPNALIGFAGARVNAGTISAELPPGFQRSEFLYEHGFLDRIVHRSELRAELTSLLGYIVPLTFEAPATIETLSVPAFRPLSFLTAPTERVIPDGDSSVAASAQAEPATPADRVEPDAPVVADATEPVVASPDGDRPTGTPAGSADGVTGSSRSRNGKAARNGKNGKAARTAQTASVDPEPGEGAETEQVTDRG